MPAMSAVTARVRVAPVEDETIARAVRALDVAPDQRRFVGDTAFNLGDTLRDLMSEAMAVLADDTVVGFYRLDFTPRAVLGRDHAEPTVGLRAFMIDQRHQGHGYGALAIAACIDDLRRAFGERLAVLDETIKASRLGVAGRRQTLVSLLRRAGEDELHGKAVAKATSNSIRTQHDQLIHQQQMLVQQLAAREVVDEELEAALVRYHALRNGKG